MFAYRIFPFRLLSTTEDNANPVDDEYAERGNESSYFVPNSRR